MEEKYDKATRLCEEGVTLAGEGTTESMRAALPKFEQARQLLQEINDQLSEANCLGWLGSINNSLGDKQKALDYYAQALPLQRAINDEGGQAAALYNIGEIYSALDDKQQALDFFTKSLPLSRAIEDKDRDAAITLYNLFYNLFAVNPGFAVFYGKQSVNIYQSLRSNMQELDESVQQAFLKSKEFVYRNLAQVLINQQRFTEAQQVLNFRQVAPLAFTTLEAGLTATFNQKLETLVAAIRALHEYKRGIGTRSPTADKAAQLQSLADEQAAANDDYLAFLKTAEREFAAPPTEKDKFPDVHILM